MRLIEDQDGWWIADVPGMHNFGPYDMRSEARDDLRGLERYFKYRDVPGFISQDEGVPAMKKDEVQIGRVYLAKVTNKVVSVRIDKENHLGGWNATNLETGKGIRIKSAQKLRGEVTGGRLPAPEPPSGPETPPEAETTRKAKTPPKAATGEAGASGGKTRMSCLDAAAVVLANSPEPMNVKAIVAAAEGRGLWKSPGGKTPWATLYSAIAAEIKKKGNESRFAKADRGRFART